MAKPPFSASKPLPKDVASDVSHDSAGPRLDTAIADDLPAERLVARNDTPAVVVCLPQQVFPSIEDGATQFQSVRTIENDTTIDEIAAALDAVTAHFEPHFGPEACYYSISNGSIQLSSNTLGQFFDDLRTIDATIAESKGAGVGRDPEPTRSTVTGACVVPTTVGVFFCKAQRVDPTESWSAEYGLLCHGVPLDRSRIQRLFDTIADDPPRHMTPWPLRQLTLHGHRSTVVPNLEPIGAATVTPDTDTTPELTHYGRNPVYDISQSDAPVDADAPEQSVFKLLRSISTLGYATDGVPEPASYTLDSIHALDPPTNGLCFVSATLGPPR